MPVSDVLRGCGSERALVVSADGSLGTSSGQYQPGIASNPVEDMLFEKCISSCEGDEVSLQHVKCDVGSDRRMLNAGLKDKARVEVAHHECGYAA